MPERCNPGREVFEVDRSHACLDRAAHAKSASEQPEHSGHDNSRHRNMLQMYTRVSYRQRQEEYSW